MGVAVKTVSGRPVLGHSVLGFCLASREARTSFLRGIVSLCGGETQDAKPSLASGRDVPCLRSRGEADRPWFLWKRRTLRDVLDSETHSEQGF